MPIDKDKSAFYFSAANDCKVQCLPYLLVHPGRTCIRPGGMYRHYRWYIRVEANNARMILKSSCTYGSFLFAGLFSRPVISGRSTFNAFNPVEKTK